MKEFLSAGNEPLVLDTPFFLDTNIIVYSFDDAHRDKQKRAQSLIEAAVRSRHGRVSTQVIQEFLHLALGKFSQRISPEDVVRFTKRFLWPLCNVYPSENLFAEAYSIKNETGWAFYDSLIVGAAAQDSCKTLFTEDLQAGRKIRGVEIRNPFK